MAGDSFRQFSMMHLLSVATAALVVVGLCVVGSRAARGADRRRLRRALGWAALGLWGAVQALWLAPGSFDAASSLPLHVCDLAGLVAALAFLTDRRAFRTILYFWGIALSTQGFVTPILTEGPGSPFFWTFWISHTINVGYAVYDIAVDGFRPGFRDLRFALGVTACSVALMFVLDALTGWNYAYVGPSAADQPTLVDALGPYPWRVVPICGIGIAAFVVAWLPWEVIRRRARVSGARG